MSGHDGVEEDPGSLVELFHLVKSVVPRGQEIAEIPPDMKVGQALDIMNEHNFSQLPIVAGGTVLGVFSFRSFASHLVQMKVTSEQLHDLPVDEFVERLQFVQPLDNWEVMLKHLNQDDAVLVGQLDRLDGIVTAMDVLNYLHSISNPFVMVAEIEQSLRRIIRACLNPEALRAAVQNSLASKYADGEMPVDLAEMTFNDYIQIIEHGHNWPHFGAAFGEGAWQRKATADRLRAVRDLRNDVFHFRRRLTLEDCKVLAKHRDWLQMKARTFEARQVVRPAVAVQPPATTRTEAPESAAPPRARRWDQASFLQDLEKNKGSAQVAAAQMILEWAKARGLFLRWGRGKGVGTCYVAMKNKGGTSVFGLWSNGYVELHLGHLKGFPPFDDQDYRNQWIRRLNAIPGVQVTHTETGQFPGFPLESLIPAQNRESFLASVAWVLDEVAAASEQH